MYVAANCGLISTNTTTHHSSHVISYRQMMMMISVYQISPGSDHANMSLPYPYPYLRLCSNSRLLPKHHPTNSIGTNCINRSLHNRITNTHVQHRRLSLFFGRFFGLCLFQCLLLLLTSTLLSFLFQRFGLDICISQCSRLE